MRYNALLDRLQNLINYKPSQKELGTVLGIAQTSVSGRANRNSNFTDEEIEKIEKWYGLADLLTGGLYTKDDVNVEYVKIDYIHIAPSCGCGTVVMDEADVTPVRIGKEVIKDIWKVSTPEVLKLFKASGDSMETTIEDGNILLVDTSRTDYHNGGIYVLTINNDWFVKRLRLKINGDLEIISDNPKYEPEILKPNTDIEINVVGRVIKNLSRGL